MIGEVAFSLPLRRTFHYQIPDRLEHQAEVGKRVRVPFGKRTLVGFLVATGSKAPVPNLKPIQEILDPKSLFDPQMLLLTRWIAERYQAAWGEVLSAALPAQFRKPKSVEPKQKTEESLSHTLKPPLKLSAQQQEVFERLQGNLSPPKHEVFLLHGVTGSGKTEIYLQAIAQVLSQGRGALMLVPEISLTPQMVERFESRFGPETVAILHSGMTGAQRLAAWSRLKDGKARVAVGVRSAVFAPVASLGLVVVDEEHEPSYKQEDSPRYHAREVAIQRAKLACAPVILGSATPALETYYSATAGSPEPSIQLLKLQERIDEAPLPEVKIVDMREEAASGRRNRIFSRALEDALAKVLEQRQQAILFLNRRGFSTFVHCQRCGNLLRCRSCQVALTYHLNAKDLRCHLCGYSIPAPDICPKCQSDYIRFQGFGTQKVESELGRIFPAARILRMDTDATKTRGSHAEILGAFGKHEADVLVGTQMVAKGLDYPKVTLVGVISADTALNLPDFRSAERTFNLLTQVAGRAGRGKLPGKVIIQTYAPHHYAILSAAKHDYQTFYRQEIPVRQQLNLPPFSRLARLIIRSVNATKAAELAQKTALYLRKKLPPQMTLTGPSQPPVPKIRRQHHWHLLLRSSDPKLMERFLPELLEGVPKIHGCHLAVDVDPL